MEACELRNQRLCLRDAREEDVEAMLRWTTVETQWQDWDAPWEGKSIVAPDEMDKARQALLARVNKPQPSPRDQLYISVNDSPLIGWVCHYHHNPEERLTFVGICVCESVYWRQGIGTEALRMWISYLFKELDLQEIRTATWSGNVRMVRVAEKCGFILTERDVDAREVNGEKFDAVQFVLTRETWEKLCE
jgi:3',5'-nucleoside bisphosphate phosphatase